jgi:hypothetical protein
VLSFFDVKSKLVTKHTNLTCFHRQNLWNTGITKEIVAKATECHLSKVNQPSSSKTKTKTKTKDCSLCQVEQSLNERTQLFDLALDLETVLEAASEQLGHRGDFDYMRQLCVDLTDEHYQLIKYFQATSSLIKAQSEVEAAKSQTQTTTTTITQHDLKLQQTQQKSMELQFRKKLNQIIYLKNLEKTYKMKDGEENRDECPICKEFFGFEWFILSCGHLLCKDCNTTMLEAGDPRQGHLNCVICREVCKHSDSYLVSTRINNKKEDDDAEKELNSKSKSATTATTSAEVELNDIQVIGGYNSAKIEGVVKCIVKEQRRHSLVDKPKMVVFSEHAVILEMIQNFLTENKLKSCLCRNSLQFEAAIEAFKADSSVNVLLMPYSYGANGLNLVEATHVILVEPTLNKSQEAQAIGRIHRIGQTKPTCVHRFIIRDTVEEQVFNLFKETSAAQDEHRRMLKVGDVISLFNSL